MGVLCSLVVFPITVSAAGDLTIKIGDVVVAPGATTVQVPITVENVTEIGYFGIFVKYDDTKFTFVDCVKGPIVPSSESLTFGTTVTDSSVVSVGLMAQTTSITSDGLLITLTFELTDAPLGTDSSLSFVDLQFGDITVTTIYDVAGGDGSGNGSIKVETPPLPSLTGGVMIDGIAEATRTLTAVTLGTPASASLQYQWFRSGEGDTIATAEPITGANGKTYTLTDDDIDHMIWVKVKANGYVGELVSIPTDEVGEVSWFTVTFNLDGGTRTGGGELTQSVISGGAAVAPIVTYEGYTFEGWSRTFSNITEDITVTARWAVNDCTVTFYLNGGTRTGGGELVQTVKSGGAAVAPTVIYEGYKFDGWDKDFDNVTEDITVMAMWSTTSPNNRPDNNITPTNQFFSVKFDVNGGTAAKGGPSLNQSVRRGGNALKPINPTRPGFIFTGWFTAPTGGRLVSSFNNITASMTYYAHWRTEAPCPFDDVSESDWFYNDVKTAWNMGLVNGMDETTYAPDNNMTYAEAIKLAACMHQYYTTGSVSLAIAEPLWYTSYVDYAVAKGIIGSSTDYDWNALATRAGYMAIFAKALPNEALPSINSVADGAIPDVPMTHPQAAAIYKLYRAGIVQGVDDNYNCNPDSNIKRSEVAAIITRMMDPSARKSFKIG